MKQQTNEYLEFLVKDTSEPKRSQLYIQKTNEDLESAADDYEEKTQDVKK